VVLDALWSSSPDASRFAARVTRQLTARFDQSAPGHTGFQNLEIDPSCTAVTSVHSDWYWNAFIFGPLSTALVLPLPAGAGATPVEHREQQQHERRQQQALDTLAERAASMAISSYFSGAWITITTLTLNGDLARACARLFAGDRGACPAERRLMPTGWAKRKDTNPFKRASARRMLNETAVYHQGR
jgi:hypothetical protein